MTKSDTSAGKMLENADEAESFGSGTSLLEEHDLGDISPFPGEAPATLSVMAVARLSLL